MIRRPLKVFGEAYRRFPDNLFNPATAALADSRSAAMTIQEAEIQPNET
jgi:hypothetical protein